MKAEYASWTFLVPGVTYVRGIRSVGVLSNRTNHGSGVRFMDVFCARSDLRTLNALSRSFNQPGRTMAAEYASWTFLVPGVTYVRGASRRA